MTNGKRFSYPGYNELLAGFPDDRIDSNNPVPNPNLNVLEWLNGLPAFRGSVAAFGAWNAFTAILNAQRSRLPVNAGWAPLRGANEETALLNRLQAFATRTWPDERDDAITYLAAREYLTRMKPRVLYLALGDTDDGPMAAATAPISTWPAGAMRCCETSGSRPSPSRSTGDRPQ